MPAYVIDLDRPGGILRAVLSGYWTSAIATAYAAELKRSAVLLRHAGRAVWIIDVSAFPVQSSEVVETLAGALSAAKAIGPEPPVVALVGSSTLGALQSKRSSPNATQHRFATIAEAEAWLAAERARA